MGQLKAYNFLFFFLLIFGPIRLKKCWWVGLKFSMFRALFLSAKYNRTRLIIKIQILRVVSDIKSMHLITCCPLVKQKQQNI